VNTIKVGTKVEAKVSSGVIVLGTVVERYEKAQGDRLPLVSYKVKRYDGKTTVLSAQDVVAL
jgi:hypothetical protein